MLTTILFLAYRRLRQKNPAMAGRVLFYIKKGGRILLVLLFCLLVSRLIFSQSQKLEYCVKKKGDSIGNVVLEKKLSGHQSQITMVSTISVRMLLLFEIKAKEEAHFENDILVRSSAIRHMNGRQQVNNATMLHGAAYKMKKGSKEIDLRQYPIRFNMLRLYFEEPQNVSMIYSDTYQQFIAIIKTGAGRYRIRFPDGATNDYSYKNGICVRMVHQDDLYTITFELIRKT